MLEGQEFYVFTDHKPLCHALDLLSAACTQRYVALISEFTWDICYLPRDKNFATDALSWPPEHSCLAPVDLPLFTLPTSPRPRWSAPPRLWHRTKNFKLCGVSLLVAILFFQRSASFLLSWFSLFPLSHHCLLFVAGHERWRQCMTKNVRPPWRADDDSDYQLEIWNMMRWQF